MVYLEKKANDWAKKNHFYFEDKIKKFKIIQKYSKNECDDIYKDYKELCIFDNLLKVSLLFENDYKLYKELNDKMSNCIDAMEFRDLYKNSLGNIYLKIFKKSTNKLSLLEKIQDSNDQILNLRECINKRVLYHYNCQKYTKDYNVKTHKHEILISIYMFNRLCEIQNLLNRFKTKYILFKEKINNDRQAELERNKQRIKEQYLIQSKEINDRYSKELSEFENISSETLSDPFIFTTRKKN
jgi:hypothetical protein